MHRLRAIVLVFAVASAGCSSSGSTPTTGCAQPHHDAFDPRSVVHVLPGSPPTTYLTDPPTSGEHQPVNILSLRGQVQVPIPPQIQVALLESSQVLIQYRPGLDITPLLPLVANRLVTLAPNPSLPAPFVATAWLWRMPCAGPASSAVGALTTFVTAHAGNGPQAPPP